MFLQAQNGNTYHISQTELAERVEYGTRTGVSVSVVEFTTDDDHVVLAYNVWAHDEASNKYKATSLKDSLSEIDWELFGLLLQA